MFEDLINNLIKAMTPIDFNSSANYEKHIVNLILTTIVGVATVAVVVAILWGGISYITSAGDETKATKARQTILAAVIGEVIVILSWTIIEIIATAVRK